MDEPASFGVYAALSGPCARILATRGESFVEGAAGSCDCSVRSKEDDDPGDLLLAKEKANDRKCPLPEGIRAAFGRLGGERVTAFLERPLVTPSAAGLVTPPA